MSILTSVKKHLGIPEEYEVFDPDLIMDINSVFSILTQMGIGPSDGYAITDKSNTWSEFINHGTVMISVKSYMFLKVKLIFDPPTNSTVLNSYQAQIAELEYRLYTYAGQY